MGELIDRQQAIDAANDWYEGLICGSINGLIKRLNALPSVQPEPSTNCSEIPNSSDTISRQAAIDALDVGAEYLRRVLDEVNLVGAEREKYKWGLGLIEAQISDIKELPSAQPEPKEGQWIRTDCGLDVECKCSRCGYKDFVEPRDEYWFKRNYCPHCGARMKGVSNERTD